MRVPPSSRSKPPDAAATASACSSRPNPWLARAALLAPLFPLVFYAYNFWGSPAFGELADQGYHLELGRAFAQAWRAGELRPTWSATANGGLGSPAFELYPPLFAALTSCWLLALDATTDALRFSSFTAVIFNLCASYWAARAWLSRSRSAVAASLALLLPGVTFLALGRGMLPNFFALGWAALMAGAARRNAPWRMGVAGAGLILTHTPTAYLVALACGALAAARVWRPSASACWAALLALAASAWFWVPMLDTAQHAQTGYLAQSHPYAESLWFAATSAQDPFGRDWRFLNEVAAWIGLAQVALAAGLLALARRPGLLVLAALTALASLWPTGEWLAALPFYGNVQFCWRWQPLLSGACALAYASLPWRTALRLAPLPALAVGFFLPLGLPSDRAPGAKPELASNLIEMRPRGASHELFPPGAPGQVERIAGDCRAIPVDLRPSRRVYHVTASTPCRLRIRTYHFPGWSARLEGKLLPIRTELATRLQLIDLPAGLHRVDLRYK